MFDQRLVNYVREARKLGLTDQDIRARLREQSWPEPDIIQALAQSTLQQPSIPPLTPAASHSPQSSITNPSPFSNFQKTATPVVTAAAVQGPRRHWVLYANVAVITLLIFGGAAYAYTAGIIPFLRGAPYSKSEVIQKGLLKITDIDTAQYELSFSFRGEPRDPAAQAFSYDKEKIMKDIEAKRPAYERDYEKLASVRSISTGLAYYVRGNNFYPGSLAELEKWMDSQSFLARFDLASVGGIAYERNANKQGYTISIQLETDEAISAVKKKGEKEGIDVSGNKVTFTNENTYISFPSFTGRPSKPPVVEFLEMRDEVLSYIPQALNISAILSGTLRIGSEENDRILGGSGTLSLDSKAEFGDAAYSLGFDLRVLNDTLYFKLNKFPGIPFIPFDPLAIKGKWIEITKEDGSRYWGIPLEFESSAEMQSAYEEIMGFYAKSLNIMAEEKMLYVVGKPKRQNINGSTAYKYNFGVTRENIMPAYNRIFELAKETEGIGSADTVQEEINELVQSELFVEFFEHLRRNNEFAIWFDKQGFPIKVQWTSRIIPLEGTKKLKDRQFVLDVAYMLTGINEPIVVQKPESYLKFDEAEELITGTPISTARNKGRNAAIKSHLSSMRAQAELVYDQNGSSYSTLFTESECPLSSKGKSLFSEETMSQLLNAAVEAAGKLDVKTRCAANARSWAAAVELIPIDEYDERDLYQCADSTGTFKEVRAEAPAEVIKGTSSGTYTCK